MKKIMIIGANFLLSICFLFAAAGCDGSVMPQKSEPQTTENQQIQTDEAGQKQDCPNGDCPQEKDGKDGIKVNPLPRKPKLPVDGKTTRPRIPHRPVPLPAPKPEI